MQKLNRRGCAGYHDWRLPTLEEAISLLESSKKNGNLYIAPIFDRNQRWIWTGDKKRGSNEAWDVNFVYGIVSWSPFNDHGFVRPVRSLKKSKYRKDYKKPIERLMKQRIDKRRKIDKWKSDHWK